MDSNGGFASPRSSALIRKYNLDGEVSPNHAPSIRDHQEMLEELRDALEDVATDGIVAVLGELEVAIATPATVDPQSWIDTVGLPAILSAIEVFPRIGEDRN